MQFIFQELDQVSAEAIAQWRYEEPYSFYDMDQDPDDLEAFLNPENWPNSYFAVRDEEGELVGFFVFEIMNGVVDIGLGLRPDLTGIGLGLHFVNTGLAFAGSRYSPERFQLRVAAFNTRAIEVYERAGFGPAETFLNRTNGAEYEFIRMEKESAAVDSAV